MSSVWPSAFCRKEYRKRKRSEDGDVNETIFTITTLKLENAPYPRCGKYAKKRGVCVEHGAKVEKWTCSVPSCGKWALRKGVCIEHGAKVERKRCSTLASMLSKEACALIMIMEQRRRDATYQAAATSSTKRSIQKARSKAVAMKSTSYQTCDNDNDK